MLADRPGSDLTDPTWSPEGRRIAFGPRTTAGGLRLANAPDGSVRQATDGPDQAPSFAPTARRVFERTVRVNEEFLDSVVATVI